MHYTTNTMPCAVEADLRAYENRVERAERKQEAIESEYRSVLEDEFTFGREDSGALDEALSEQFERNDNLHELAAHIRHGNLYEAQKIVDEAIRDWAWKRAESITEKKRQEREEERSLAKAGV